MAIVKIQRNQRVLNQDQNIKKNMNKSEDGFNFIPIYTNY